MYMCVDRSGNVQTHCGEQDHNRQEGPPKVEPLSHRGQPATGGGGGGGKGEERQDVSQEVKGMYEERKVNVVVREQEAIKEKSKGVIGRC